ncbi:hypothetical protein F0562_026464 [Nyssa sinensis]|uniref:Uncharacterized protein n=1 Tax=Nyssa sinensis TaxID=561372 RepID=A0A5J5BCZ8_9ASTE|nr:hypothetical protein F0562_026464 [Nyssa sinensis]
MEVGKGWILVISLLLLKVLIGGEGLYSEVTKLGIGLWPEVKNKANKQEGSSPMVIELNRASCKARVDFLWQALVGRVRSFNSEIPMAVEHEEFNVSQCPILAPVLVGVESWRVEVPNWVGVRSSDMDHTSPSNLGANFYKEARNRVDCQSSCALKGRKVGAPQPTMWLQLVGMSIHFWDEAGFREIGELSGGFLEEDRDILPASANSGGQE